MSNLTNIPTQGYLLVGGWKFEINADGATGTRVYLHTDEVLPNSTLVNIPKIGDSWDEDWPDVVVKSIDVGYYESELCGQKITVNYGPRTISFEIQGQSADDLLKNVDVAGEALAVKSQNQVFRWEGDTSDNKYVKQDLYLTIAKGSIRMFRIIKSFNSYMRTVFERVNTVNQDNILGFPSEMLRFNGVSCQEFRDRSGFKRWRVELVFEIRSVTGNFTAGKDGWNYVFRETTGQWQKVKNESTDEGLYKLADWDELFAGDPLGDNEDLFNAIPEQ